MAFLSWGLLEFGEGYATAGLTSLAKDAIRWGADYIAACHTDELEYVGQIGDPGIDHAYWGRAEQQTGSRPAYTWNSNLAASDLASSAASALASASLVFASEDASYSASLLEHAQRLFDMASRREGFYSDSFTSVTYVYRSSTFLDDLAFAAAWLWRATKNPSYLSSAQGYLQRAQYSRNYYVNWDAVFPAADMLLKSQGAPNSPGVDLDYQLGAFRSTWEQNQNGLTSTPKGLSIPPLGGWGNLRHALNAAFITTIHAKYTNSSSERAADLAYAKRQLEYALGSSGRSFVVGHGVNPPTHEHHRGASCPDMPAACGWDQFNTPNSNPQVLYGALVGGPTSSDSDYQDVRDNYQSNEVAVDYNAGYTGVLAGLIQLL